VNEWRTRLKEREDELASLRQDLENARERERAAVESLAEFRKRFPSAAEEKPDDPGGQ
jgi:hypothetical protein